jgi:hypothetical protein
MPSTGVLVSPYLAAVEQFTRMIARVSKAEADKEKEGKGKARQQLKRRRS